MDHEIELRQRENDLLRLRARYASDPLIRAVLGLELAIRRAIRQALFPAHPESSRPYRQR